MLLGPLEVRDDDDRPVEIPGARLRALLARLALEPGRAVSPAALTAAIWEETTGESNVLQALVSRLRRAIGSSAVRSDPAGYRLAVQPEDVDVARFERLVAAGRDTADLAALRHAEALWRGPALADLTDAPFAAKAAVRLDELRLTATETRLDLELAAGHDILPELGPLADAHPLRESVQGLLMRALYAAGRQAEALETYDRTRRALAGELGVDPSATLAELHVAVLRHAPDLPVLRKTPPTNLRAQMTSFVGREEEIAQLMEVLSAGRLATLVGPGGAGKTRLAVETAACCAETAIAPDGVWLVELASVTDPLDVDLAVLTAVGAREAGMFDAAPAEPGPARRDAVPRLLEFLTGRRTLLVVDNCEHVVSAVAELADRLLRSCPGLRILATSREPLAIDGERLYPVPPLTTPEDGHTGDPLAYSALRLFAERATAVRPDFALDAENAAPVIEICRRLDGMPLAIELAAARLRSLSVERIAAWLDDRFRLLTSGRRTALPRHRTLQAVVDWSWNLLSGKERELAMRLAAFPAGATFSALEEVAELDSADVLELLTGLVDKSLVEHAGGRYRMLETIRSYGMERLAETGGLPAARDAHARYFLRLAETADPELRKADQLHWMRVLHAEHDNILAALRYAVDVGDPDLGVRLVAAMWWFWFLRGSRTEGTHWARTVLAIPGDLPDPLRTMTAVLRALTGYELGEWDPNEPEPDILGTPRDTLEVSDDAPGSVLLLVAPLLPLVLRGQSPAGQVMEGMLPKLTGWVRAAALFLASMTMEGAAARTDTQAALEEVRREFERLGERWGLATTWRSLAALHALGGDLGGSIAASAQALRLAAELGVPEDQAGLNGELATMHARAGDLDRARSHIAAALDHAERVRQPDTTAYVRLAGAEVMLRCGEREAARRELDAVESAVAATGDSAAFHVWAAGFRAMAALLDGDPETARRLLDAAIEAGGTAAGGQILANAMHMYAAVALEDGEATHAAYLLGLATALRGSEDRSGFDGLLRPEDRARAALGDTAYASAYERGAALSRDAALQGALHPAGLHPGHR
ncbi:BTAD domain-containing putative transcriptional regulator [Microtetraspora malaysiensis]|uniref:BTAD domain-containing putative transcriptional regulator n=1 Tax=Microtetraspora malaysiensis TaxID=161358 RepID=UPI003D8F3802